MRSPIQPRAGSSRISARGGYRDNRTPNRMHSGNGISRPSWYDSTLAEVEANLAAAGRAGDNAGEFKCCYCDNVFPREALEIEHITPYSRIGMGPHVITDMDLKVVTNDIANLTYACGKKGNSCNQSKREKPLFQYLSDSNVCTRDEFFQRTPWALWMYVDANMVYKPSWSRDHSHNPLTQGYNDERDFCRAARATSITPRSPFRDELCLVNRRGIPVISQSCMAALIRMRRVSGLTEQDIKNVDNHNKAHNIIAIAKQVSVRNRHGENSPYCHDIETILSKVINGVS